MRLKNYFLLLPLLLSLACSSDDSTNQNQDTLLTLKKIEKFSPSRNEYLSGMEGSEKQVSYYENNKIIADTLFLPTGTFFSRKEYIYNGNIHESYVYFGNTLRTYEKLIYDNLGRIIERKSILYISGLPYDPTGIEIFDYHNNGTFERIAVDPDTGMIMPQYTIPYFTNSNGFISSIPFFLSQSESIFTYENDKPLQYAYNYSDGSSININFTYYDVQVPSNMLKTSAETNNSIILGGHGTENADNCNYHLMSYTGGPEGPVTFEKTFNEFGYVTYSKAQGSMHQYVYDSESFYYYN